MRLSRNSRQVRRPNLTPSYEAPKKPIHTRNIVRPLMLILAIFGITYLIFGSGLFKVQKITTAGNKTLTSVEIERQMREAMKQTIFGSNWLFLDTRSLERTLKSNNYQLGQVSIKKRLPTNLLVQVDERRPSLSWRSADKTYILSEDGRAFAELTDKNNDLPLIIDFTNLPIELGSQIVPKDFIIFTIAAFDGLSKQGIAIEQASVKESTSELYVKTKKGYLIKFDTQRSVSEQLSNLETLLNNLRRQNKTIAEYVDLRIKNQVISK